jgi:hypothetical protein
MQKVFMVKYLLLFLVTTVFANCHSGGEKISNKYTHALTLEQHEQIDLGRIYAWPSVNNKLTRPHFILGMKYLHNFMYDLARVEFQHSTSLDPKFALGYWGELMTYKHPLWGYENRDAALSVLDKITKKLNFRELNALEKDLLNATKILYAKSKNDYQYMLAMQKAAKKNQKNIDLQALYALSIMGHVEQNLDNKYIKVSRDLLKNLFENKPYNPGVLHYMIHAFDTHDVSVAKQALIASNHYLDAGQDSSHGAHMPSHIYFRLGMWEKAALSNQLSVNASNEICKKYGIDEYWCDAENKYHSMEWLHYSYLQMGLFSRARELVGVLKKIVSIDSKSRYKEWYFAMLARQILAENIEIKPYLPLKIAISGSDLFQTGNVECNLLAVIGMRAKKGSDSDISKIRARINEIIDLVKGEKNPSSYMTCSLALMQLDADVLYDKGDYNRAFEILGKAKRLEKDIRNLPKHPELPFLITNDKLIELLRTLGHQDLSRKDYIEHLREYFNKDVLV